MEHRLIQGGESFLPFARSCVAKLKKLGLPYADQSYEVDGVSIKVRIEPGHEYIRIEGGTTSLGMDSGVVDVRSDSIFNPLAYQPGVWWESLISAAYNAPFRLVGTDDVYRTNPEQVPVHQMSGIVSLASASGLKGRVRLSGTDAASFSPKKDKDGAYSTADDELLWKKLMVARCPASMFTGRCRLYVQAMYGSHLYTTTNKKNTLDAQPSPPTLGNTEVPSIKVPGYGHESVGYVVLDTSSGVALIDGEHWLYSIEADDVARYPMISSPAGEKARKILASGKVGSTVLQQDDLDRLEAYVLKDCRPVVEKRTVIGSAVGLPNYSMGYGWHWNWDATAADLVSSYTFSQGGLNEAMTSTHYRLSISTANGVSRATSSVVEGPTNWALNRWLWIVTEPDWKNGGSEKTTPRYSSMFACDAPFYAFYIKNTLNVCRVKVSYSEPDDPVRDMSYTETGLGFGGEGYGAPIYETTTGLLGGFCEDVSGGNGYWEVAISCGEVSTPAMPDSKVNIGVRSETANKAITKDPNGPGFTTIFDSWTYEYGYPTADGEYASDRLFSSMRYSQGVTVTYDSIVSHFSDFYSSLCVCAVPSFDAESIFLQWHVKKARSFVSRTTTKKSNTAFITRSVPTFVTIVDGSPVYSAGEVYYKYIVHSAYNDYPVLAPVGIVPEAENSDLSKESYAINRAGSPNLSYYVATDEANGAVDKTPDPHTSFSGASVGSDAVFLSGNRAEPHGVATLGAAPAIVGYT